MITNILGIVMKYLYELVHNYGIAIILFTIFSKIILLPISVLVQKNSVKLISLKPKINKIKIDYYGDDDRIAELESELYKQKKYNPFLSTIPLILQIIILICLVKIVNNPITYITNISNDTKTTLINEVGEVRYPELEVIREVKNGKLENEELNNLNLTFMNYDLIAISSDIHNYLFPILAAVSALIYCIYQMKQNVLQKEQSKVYNYITIIMCVLLSLYLGLYVPRGVVLYWIFSNLLAIFQLMILNIIINPKKYIDYNELENTNKKLAQLSFDDRSKYIIKKEKEDYKRFFKIDNKHLVIYSEDGSYYKYVKDTINYILEHTNIIIHYITSDYNDDILKTNIPNFKTYFIGEKKLIPLMMKMDSDVVLMTVPDLNRYHLKRSYVRKDVEYIHQIHGISSTLLVNRKGAFDYFDTIFCYGDRQKKEFLKENKESNLNRKIVEIGYPLLDNMIKEYKEKNDGTIIIAPSWQKDNIMELCIDNIISILSKKYKIIIRAHPYYIKHNIDKFNSLKERYKKEKNVIIQDDYSTDNNVLNCELLITDWSSIGTEYAFVTKKPVIYINTPMKIINDLYEKYDMEPIEICIRNIVGKSVELNDIRKLDKIVADVIKNKDKYAKEIEKFRDKNVYNIGNSAIVAGDYIISTIKEKIDRRKNV